MYVAKTCTYNQEPPILFERNLFAIQYCIREMETKLQTLFPLVENTKEMTESEPRGFFSHLLRVMSHVIQFGWSGKNAINIV